MAVSAFGPKSAGMGEEQPQDWAELLGLLRQLIAWAGVTVAIFAVFEFATLVLHLASWVGQLLLVAWRALIVSHRQAFPYGRCVRLLALLKMCQAVAMPTDAWRREAFGCCSLSCHSPAAAVCIVAYRAGRTQILSRR
jgi:hypothetical protein